jgi:hypothetical protein
MPKSEIRLARAVRTEQAEQLTVGNVEADTVDRVSRRAAVAFDQVTDLNSEHCR